MKQSDLYHRLICKQAPLCCNEVDTSEWDSHKLRNARHRGVTCEECKGGADLHTCVKCQKELKWQAFSAEVRKQVFIQKCLKKIEADACVCIGCAIQEDGKKRKAEHCVPRNTDTSE